MNANIELLKCHRRWQMQDSPQLMSKKSSTLGLKKNLAPICVCTKLMVEEEEYYFKLHFEYKDVFPRNYEKILPKVVVQNLSIKIGVSPKKKALQHLCPSWYQKLKMR